MSEHTSKILQSIKSIQSAVVVVQTRQKVVAFNYPTYESKTASGILRYSPLLIAMAAAAHFTICHICFEICVEFKAILNKLHIHSIKISFILIFTLQLQFM